MTPTTTLPQHRGLTWEDIPGRNREQKKMRFAEFKRGQWPPANCKLDARLQGKDCLAALLAYAGKFAAAARDGHVRAGRKLRGGAANV